MSVGTTNANGMLPNNEYERYNFSSRNTTKFLNDKLTLDVGFSFIIQKDLNLTAQGQYFNPLSAVYLSREVRTLVQSRLMKHSIST